MEAIHQPPASSSFTPLAVHQSQTPESFYSGPPVLYHHSPSASLLLHTSDLAATPALSRLANGAHRSANGTSAVAINGHGAAEEDDDDEEIEIAGVDVWVTSERFILYSPTLSTGLSIPYPSISLHALQRPSERKPASLFLQLLTEAQTFDDHDPDSTISMTLVPAAARAEDAAEEVGHDAPEPESQAQLLYTALSACANLHPDPMSGSEADGEEEEGGGGGGGGQRPAVMFEGDQDVGGIYPLNSGEGGGSGLPPPMPGSGGWITAENVGELFDEEGNWRGDGGLGQQGGVSGGGGDGGGLGEGAGTVRTREEDVDGEDAGVEGEGTEETKWRRTE